ncbi:MAG: sensor histidine kinase [Treponema sp.]|nr:sensor histidine kinase [Treponema sp.]
MNKPVHFKEEIQRSFITHSLMPAVAFATLIIFGSLVLWFWNLYRHSRRESNAIAASLFAAVDAYKNFPSDAVLFSKELFSEDAAALSKAYGALKTFVHAQNTAADFTLLSPSYEIILQGSSDAGFIVPTWQNDFTWGALGRMQKKRGQAVVEIASEYNARQQPEIITGRAVVQNDVLVGYLVFSIGEKNFQMQLHGSLPYAITDSKGVLFACSNASFGNQMNRLQKSYRQNRQFFFTGDYAVFYTDTADALFSVYTFSNVAQMKTIFLLIIITTLSLLGFVISGLLVSAKKIAEEESRTITQIVEVCGEVERGNLGKRLSVDGNIEFQKIAAAYNNMLDTVQRLVDEKSRETHERYVAEIKQLEMQFNPHFLYNTLENIKFLIKLNPDMAQNTILRLSELLRYSINNDISVVPIGEDIRYIENYLSILKLRFNEKFSYVIDVPPEVYDCAIPKLIMQPLIDNAVKHGFADTESMTLKIAAHVASQKLVIIIQDDGAGIADKTLLEMHSLLDAQSNRTNHIGLYNVQRRIQLMYGEQYGMQLDSVFGEGTVVRITLPVLRGAA